MSTQTEDPSIFADLLPARHEPYIEDPIGTPFQIGDSLVVVPIRVSPGDGWYACRVQVANTHYPVGSMLALSAQDLVDGRAFDLTTLTWGAGASTFGPAPLP